MNMWRRLLLSVLAILLLADNPGYSQVSSGEIFGKGDNVLSAGVGLGGYYNYTSSSGFSQTPSYMLTYENCSVDPFGANGAIGLGGYVAYLAYSNTWTDGYSYTDKYTFEFAMFRAAYHYHIRYSAKIDPYGGLTLGYVFSQHNFSTTDPNYTNPASPGYSAYSAQGESPFTYGAYIGARYYLGGNFGIWAELVIMNHAYNYIGLGLTIKM